MEPAGLPIRLIMVMKVAVLRYPLPPPGSGYVSCPLIQYLKSLGAIGVCNAQLFR